MEYRSLGRTGLKVSSLALGGDHFGIPDAERRGQAAMRGSLDPAASARLIAAALDGGITMIDTAESYNHGRSEEAVGAALRSLARRNDIVVATKAGQSQLATGAAQPTSRRHVIAACEASLRRLGTDWIDLYQLHRTFADVPVDESLRALDDLVRSGKVRYLGVSNVPAWQLVESLWASKELGLARFVSTQPPYNLLDRRIERELVPMALTYGVGMTVWSPLAGGLLSGQYRRNEAPPPGSRFSEMQTAPESFLGALYQRRWGDRMFDALEGCEAVAREHGAPLSQFALAWCIGQPGVSTAIIGPRTAEQLADNLKAADIRVDDAARKALDEAVAPGTMVSPFYDPDLGLPARW